MDERMAQIEHVISHYLHRDLFRIYVRDFMQRTNRRQFDAYRLSISHYTCNGGRLEDWQPAESTINRTRESLKRIKPVTLEYLHDLLHAEPLLAIHEHAHQDGAIFTYVIHETDL